MCLALRWTDIRFGEGSCGIASSSSGFDRCAQKTLKESTIRSIELFEVLRCSRSLNLIYRMEKKREEIEDR